MKPLKAHVYVPKKLRTPCFAQPKLNGVRALYQHGQFYSGDEIPWKSTVLQHLASELGNILSTSPICLDGELYVHGWSLQRINSAVAVKRNAPTVETPSIEYHVFDCVRFNTPFIDRWGHIRELLAPAHINGTNIKLVETSMVTDLRTADAHFAQSVLSRYEGSMYRMGECLYTTPGRGATKDNRTWDMLKRKAWQDADFRVVGVQEGKHTDLGGKYVGTLGAFVLTTESGHVFTASPAFTDTERLQYFREPPIGLLAQVKYLNLSDDGIPLHPTVLAIREA